MKIKFFYNKIDGKISEWWFSRTSAKKWAETHGGTFHQKTLERLSFMNGTDFQIIEDWVDYINTR